MNPLLTSGDLIQHISQYSHQVYCKLRLVSKDVKEKIDEVLPKNNAKSQFFSWSSQFIEKADWCGYKLLDRRDFELWIEAISNVLRFRVSDLSFEEKLEKFCRDYLPKNGLIGMEALRLLCRYNRVDYVKELWDESGDKKTRFHTSCVEVISFLDDFEFFKYVYEYFEHRITGINLNEMMSNAGRSGRYTSVLYILNKHPKLRETIFKERLGEAYSNWDLFQKIVSAGKDRKTVLKIVKQNGWMLEYAYKPFLTDKEIVLEAVKSGAEWLLESLDAPLCDDRDVVMAAVTSNGDALQLAPDFLVEDKEIVMAAVKQDPKALNFCGTSLQNDEEVVMEAVKRNGLVLKYVYAQLRNSKKVVLEAVKQNPRAIKYANESLKDDYEVILEAVKKDGELLSHASPSLRKDKSIVIAAVSNKGHALRHADALLHKDIDVVFAAVKWNAEALENVTEYLLTSPP